MTADAIIRIKIDANTGEARVIKRDLDQLGKSGDKATKSAMSLKSALVAIGGATAAITFMRSATAASIEFSTAMSELSTLLGETKGEMDALTAAAKAQAIQFGSTPVQQSKALYQIISAGAQNATEATETLTAANKLAIGGVTDITTAADGLTSVMNAYGDKVESATAASDSLFIAMRAGKTTIGELSAGLGKVAPLAATVGVEFDELTAAVSALTKGGISTQESITGVRAILAAIAKPTSEARDLASELGIEFNAAGLEAQGFAGFIGQLTEKTGGSTEKLAQLFGGVEALVPILALSGEAGVSFAEILEQMGDKAGATETAFNKMADSPGFKLKALLAAMKVEMLETGDKLVTVLAPAFVLLTENMESAVSVIKILAYSAVPALTVAIGTGLVNAVRALTVAMAANPLMAGAIILVGAITAFIEFREEIFETLDTINVFGTTAGDVFRDIGNGAKTIFAGIATIIGGTFLGLKNVLYKTINDAQVMLFKFYDGINGKFGLDYTDELNAVAARIDHSMIGKSFKEVAQQGFNTASQFGLDMLTDDFEPRTPTAPLVPQAANSKKPYKEVNESLKTATAESKKLTKELDVKMPDAVDDLSNQIERDLTGSFKDAFSESGLSFDKLMSGMQGSFSNLMGNIATQAARPIMLNLVAGVTGAAGFAGSANAAGIGGGSGGGFGGMGNLLSMGKNLMGGLNTPIFGGGSMIGGAIDKIGFNLGLTNNGLANATGTLSTAFTPGAALGGFGGNMLANAIFGGDRGIGASIGGGIGGIGGTAVGASVLGPALGAFGGPVGALAGSFIGNAIGGLFGGSKPSDKWQSGGINLQSFQRNTNGFTGKKFSQKNADYRDSLLDQIEQLSKMLISSGAELSGGIAVEIGNRDGLRLTETGPIDRKRNFGYDNEAFVKAINDSVINRASGLSSNLTTALGNTDTGSMKAIAETIQFVDLIEGFGAETVPPLTAALDQLSASFEGLKTKAIDLGLPVEKVTEAYEKQREAIVSGALTPLQNFLDSQALSSNSSLSPGDRLSFARSQFDENLSAIQGGDLSNLGNITGQASQLLNIGRDVFASGEGFSSLESFVRQSITGIAGDLGAPGGLENEIGREITLSNAKQTSILEQQNLIIQEQAAELRKLRKAMERVGNFMVTA